MICSIGSRILSELKFDYVQSVHNTVVIVIGVDSEELLEEVDNLLARIKKRKSRFFDRVDWKKVTSWSFKIVG